MNEGIAAVVIKRQKRAGRQIMHDRDVAAGGRRDGGRRPRSAVSAMAMLRGVFFRGDKRRATSARVLLRQQHSARRVEEEGSRRAVHVCGRKRKNGGRRKKEGNFICGVRFFTKSPT